MKTTCTWPEYFEKTKNKPPRPDLLRALPHVKEREEALDLGAGSMNDTRYLVAEGFKHVTAVEKSLSDLGRDVTASLPSNVTLVNCAFEQFPFTWNRYDLVNAQYSLFFNPKRSISQLCANIIESLKPGGIFVGQFLGMKDEWYSTDRIALNFHTAEQLKYLLSGLQFIEFKECEEDTPTVLQTIKHWHLFRVIGRK